jgi:hypothetical protein
MEHNFIMDTAIPIVFLLLMVTLTLASWTYLGGLAYLLYTLSKDKKDNEKD